MHIAHPSTLEKDAWSFTLLARDKNLWPANTHGLLLVRTNAVSCLEHLSIEDEAHVHY